MSLFRKDYHRDGVFVAGGQPTVRYVQREDQHIERNLARAIATPNQIVSLSGTTKTGKTVLCRRILGSREFIWLDGGQHSTAESVWAHVARELRLPDEISESSSGQFGATLSGSIPLGRNRATGYAITRYARSASAFTWALWVSVAGSPPVVTLQGCFSLSFPVAWPLPALVLTAPRPAR